MLTGGSEIPHVFGDAAKCEMYKRFSISFLISHLVADERGLVEVGPAAPRAGVLLRRRRVGVAGGAAGRGVGGRGVSAGDGRGCRARHQGCIQDGEGRRGASCNGGGGFATDSSSKM